MSLLQTKGEEKATFEEKWGPVRVVVNKLLQQVDVTKSEWQDVFWTVHMICQWDDSGAGKVKNNLTKEVEAFISQAKERVQANQEESALLRAYISEWRRFFEQCAYLPRPFGVLEPTLSHKPGQSLASNGLYVRKLMLDLWNTTIFSHIKARLQFSAMKLVSAERRGEAFDAQLVIGVRESYVNLNTNSKDQLGIYKANFEAAYIEALKCYYETEGSEVLSQNGILMYMKYADEKMTEELERGKRYLEQGHGSDSQRVLHKTLVEVLIEQYLEQLTQECPGLIRANQTDKLQVLFQLIDNIPKAVDPLLASLEEHIRTSGLEDMRACADTITSDPEKYVDHLLMLFHRFTKIVDDGFKSDHRFLKSRDEAFRFVVNDTSVFKLELLSQGQKSAGMALRTQPESRCPELLATYCDLLLRKSQHSRKLDSEQIEHKLKEVVTVLKYIQNKDVFMRFHKSHLTRRLILDTSADSEKEENMVAWLREAGMPADYVNKLGRMFQDIKVTDDLNAEFKDCSRQEGMSDIASIVNVKILNAGAWARGSGRTPVSLPMELEDYIPLVEDFYKRKHEGRKLQWSHSLSNGVLVFTTEGGKYDLEVTTFQMAVLCAWNQRPKSDITFHDLRLATELPEMELRRTLWTLVQQPKLKRQVLLFEPKVSSGRDFTDATIFRINHKFCLIKNNQPQRRGKVPLIGKLQLGTEQGRTEDSETIVALRVLRIQEAIIKIMKMRKRLSNAVLQTELVQILKNMFLPQKKMIKEQIEWLIDHKYLQRHENDMNSFEYLA